MGDAHSWSDLMTHFIHDIFWLSRAVFWRSMRKIGLTSPTETQKDQEMDHIAPFDEYPFCDMCGNKEDVVKKLITKDGCQIVECNKCKLWFTSPRINERTWSNYLKTATKRSIEFTENRLKYGVPLASNVRYSHPFWRKKREQKNQDIVNKINQFSKIRTHRIHDVGCGVGFFIDTALKNGMEVTGNELNKYACNVMRNRFGFKVYNNIITNIDLGQSKMDAIVMDDYIEHTYHPFEDLKKAKFFLKPGGIIFIKTFHIDCRAFHKHREKWNYLFWNHVYHFSPITLNKMIEKAGFRILEMKYNYEHFLITVIAEAIK